MTVVRICRVVVPPELFVTDVVLPESLGAVAILQGPCAKSVIPREPCTKSLIREQPCTKSVIPQEPCTKSVIPQERSDCREILSRRWGQFVSGTVCPDSRSLRSLLRDDSGDCRAVIMQRPCAKSVILQEPCTKSVIPQEPCAKSVIPQERSDCREILSHRLGQSTPGNNGRSPRPGFTLFEMAIVLAIMALSAALVIPALARLGLDKQPEAAAGVLTLLHDARKTAIDRNTMVSLRIDPVTGRYRADTTGVAGTGKFAEGSIQLDATETLVTEEPRLKFIFRPTGAVFADSVLVRGMGATVLVTVDPWSGLARADAR
ncbi:MAG: hypothetical protein JWM95_5629 [Gemmatimonadetes bacterium]|nr:hypothetical protein [Gemmatimonadota bacterium]